MIIVLADRYDVAAHRWATQWASRGVVLLTPDDLSRAGWRHSLGTPADGVAIVGGRSVRVADITAVLVRLPCVYEQNLPRIVPADRGYVAAEMTAFLLSWLTELPCPVLNRPTPICLAGPYWRAEQWTHVAARVGIPVAPVHRRVAPGASLLKSLASGVASSDAADTVTVTVVGDRHVGEGNEALRRHASRLADAADVALLAVRFTDGAPGARFVGANPWPPLDDAVTGAIFAHICEQAVEQRS